jgi:hypothetical protein
MKKPRLAPMRLLILSSVLFFLFSCSNDTGSPDVEGINADISVQRFDRDFFSIDTTNLNPSLDSLYKKYPTFLPLYFEFLSPINYIVHQERKSYSEAILTYFRNIKSLSDSVQKQFADFSPYEKGIEKGLRYIKYYFPSFHLPAVYTSVESLNPENKEEIYGALFFRDTLVISLQMFLGQNYSAYDPAMYYDYLRRRFEPEYIVPNSLRAIAQDLYPDTSQEAGLIEQMIEKGKQWYILDHVLPDTPDSLITFYTNRQLDWCNINEGNIWAAIQASTPNLFTIEPERIQNYLGEAPFTPDLQSQASPGNIGQWVGWRIVEKFAERNPKLSLQQILSTPAMKIFQEAKYRPK